MEKSVIPSSRRSLPRSRTNSRVTSRHLDHLIGNRVDTSNSNWPYGLTCSPITGLQPTSALLLTFPLGPRAKRDRDDALELAMKLEPHHEVRDDPTAGARNRLCYQL